VSLKYTIPATFRRFDTRVSSDDQFINMRDQLYLRQNYNILVARRLRQPIMHVAFDHKAQSTFSQSAVDLGMEILASGDSYAQGNLLASAYVYFWQAAPQIVVTVYGSATKASPSVYLHAVLVTPGDNISGNSSAVAAFSGGTTRGKTQLTVDVPPNTAGGKLSIYAECSLDGSDVAAVTETVTGSGPDWVETDVTPLSFAVGDYIYLSSNPSETLRRIRRAYVYDSKARYEVHPPWSLAPVKDDEVNAQQLNVYVPETITAWCARESKIV
jgi:hypothetical protein